MPAGYVLYEYGTLWFLDCLVPSHLSTYRYRTATVRLYGSAVGHAVDRTVHSAGKERLLEALVQPYSVGVLPVLYYQYIVLYCTVLYYVPVQLYSTGTVLYSTVLYSCTVPYCTAVHST